ncbi:MAG TPA: GH3 auxin-responsive promoter family protein [Desulfitobacteriaceae bacterium]|nr:GH3 auxin-responsive promoter family protein [Desulfitobacteriaceae bacterium]
MMERFICYLINSLCCLLYRKEYQAYIRIKDVGSVQKEKLFSVLSNNKSSAYGIKYTFAEIKTIEEFQQKVPLTVYEDYQPYLEKIKKGQKNVLTTEEILLLELSSGSTSASKLIPYTRSLKEEFQKGLKPWLYDLYSSYQAIKWGKSYWSLTPVHSGEKYSEGGIPIGFEDDKEYFGNLEKELFNYILAVPSVVTRSDNMEEFYYRTALGLLTCRDLTLISVWNPSLFILLLEFMEKNEQRLAAAVILQNKKRGREVKVLLREKAFRKLWPNLNVISCWGDAGAKYYAAKLQAIFPEAVLQPKGLLATEGFISFPFSEAQGAVLSLKSHFFEFEAREDNKIYLAEELEKGKEYAVILTTSGGLYRYRLRDLIQVTGFWGRIPIIKFLGKQDKVSDLFGEKLNELFVKAALEKSGIKDRFFMLAPESDRYVLYTKTERVPAGLEEALRENFHYDYCRKLGQLKEVKVFNLTGNPRQEYLEECVKRGQRLGDIKPVVLHLQGGWDRVFKGEYL